MALRFSSFIANCSSVRLVFEERTFALRSCTQIRERHKLNPKPRLRNPVWFVRKDVVKRDENLTVDNQTFLKEVVQNKLIATNNKQIELPTNIEWKPSLQRTGVIARKIGIYPMWLKDGTRIQTTLLQVLDNHVIKYFTPETYDPPRKRVEKIYNKKGCLLIGAEAGDPTNFTKEYCGLFNESGVIPKKILSRFFVSPDAALPLGTLVTANHFQVGNYVDVRGKTIDRGFQGVMKRHGFKGMGASHGVTKTHRRGGNIGGGGEKGRVWPGTKMPGHMGNRYRICPGLKIWRINTKYNVMWVSGQAIPGETNSIVYVFDTKLPLRKPQKPVPFPTFLENQEHELPENIFDEDVHKFGDETTMFQEKK